MTLSGLMTGLYLSQGGEIHSGDGLLLGPNSPLKPFLFWGGYYDLLSGTGIGAALVSGALATMTVAGSVNLMLKHLTKKFAKKSERNISIKRLAMNYQITNFTIKNIK